jgi:hypothetical protein
VSSRLALIVLVIVCVAAFALEVALLSRDQDNTRSWVARADRAKGEMVDRLDMTDSADAFRAGTLRHATLVSGDDGGGPVRVVLREDPQHGYPREGTWTSPQVRTAFAFTEMVPSWNVITPPQTGVRFEVRAREAATQQWSPWLRIGAWGRIAQSHRRDECDLGRVKTDTLFLDRPADAYQIRATLQSFVFDQSVNPAVRRIAVCYSGPANEDSLWAKAAHPDPGPPQRWARDLKIPFRPQGDNAAPVIGETCSPTSVSMVLCYWGLTGATMENALAIWDDHNALFGNWSNATQRASELGMDAWLQRFRNWDQVKEMIARGQPVVASIRFEKGTFPDAPIYQATGGHLIVIRGFTPDGKVIVNDPANRAKGNGALYPAAGLAHAWFGNGGVGYVIRPPARPLPAAMVKGFTSPTTRPTPAPAAPAAPAMAAAPQRGGK